MLHVIKGHVFTEFEFKWPLVYLKVVLKFKINTGDLYMAKIRCVSPLRIN